MKESFVKNILILFYGVGILGFFIPLTAPYFKALTPFILLMNLIVVLLYQRNWSLEIVLAMSFIVLAGFGVEWMGIQTGIIFGEYAYGSVLGPKIGNTALIIGVNWLLLVLGSYYLSASFQLSYWGRIVTGAVLMLMYDWVLEPVAIHLGMWNWKAGTIPVQNYIAWFLLSLCFHYVYGRYAKRSKNKIAGFIFIIQLLFFIVLRFAIELHLM